MLPSNSFGRRIRNSLSPMDCTFICFKGKIARRKLIQNKFTGYKRKVHLNRSTTSMICCAFITKYIFAIKLAEYTSKEDWREVFKRAAIAVYFMHACACKKIEFVYGHNIAQKKNTHLNKSQRIL